MNVEKFLEIAQVIKDYKDIIEEFNIFPVNDTYENGTYKACQSVVLALTLYPKLTEEEENELRNLGFSVYLDESISSLQIDLA